ncbi:MAG: hypothetical protein AXW14_02540 [Alteromonas sp. Nap_26]|nr:MAG: hypothetical protein AXW14_02540 [Alteromonas sp. Nap_26]
MKFSVPLNVAYVFSCLTYVLSPNALASNVDSDHSLKTQEARMHAKALGAALQAKLKQAIQSGGLEEGVNACHLAAEPIATALSVEGWTVGRTALKVRNPNNSPDAWEQTQLTMFAEQLAKSVELPNETGETLSSKKPLEATHFDKESNKFRYMMAIETKPVCIACHGSDISPTVKEVIDTHYPNDQATGFDIGSLRGAFTLIYTESQSTLN